MCQQYEKAVQTVLDFLVEQGFSKTTRRDFRRTTREFRGYLEEGRLEYSDTRAQSWVNTLKPSLPRRKFLSSRRSLALVDDAAINACVTNVRFSYDDESLKHRVPECYRQLLDEYIERRRQDGNQPSTLQMDSSACTRFLSCLSG